MLARKARVVVLAMLFIFVGSMLAPGCGCTEKETVEPEEEVAEASEPAVRNGESAPQSVSGGGEPSGTQQAGGDYDFNAKEIGSKTPLQYLKLVDVRWSDEGDHFRLVAELKRGDWSDATELPWCFTDYPEDPTVEEQGLQIRLYIRGIRGEDIDVSSLQAAHGRLTGDDMCYQLLMTTSNSVDGVPAVNLFIFTRAKRPHRLTYAMSPMRIIVDVLK